MSSVIPSFEGWQPPPPPEDTAPLYGQLGLDQTVALINDGQHVEGVTFLDDSSSAQIYRVEHELATLVLRLATPTPLRRDGLTSSEWIQSRVQALEAGRARNIFEQLVTYSLQDEAAVTLFAPGKTLFELSTTDVKRINPEQLAVTIDGIAKGADEARIRLDTGSSNFLYDYDKGFTIVDYHLEEDPEQSPSAGVELTAFLGCIAYDTAALSSPPDHYGAWLRVFDESLRLIQQRGIDPYALNPRLESYHRELQERAHQ